MEGAEATLERMEGAAAVEKKVFVFFALCNALRERRCTPRVVIMVNDVDDEVGEQARRSSVQVFPRIKFLFALSFTSAMPTCSESSLRLSYRPGSSSPSFTFVTCFPRCILHEHTAGRKTKVMCELQSSGSLLY